VTSRVHPCGSLPIRSISTTVWYCEHHQAWFWSSLALREDGADEPTTLHSRSGEFGPFDAAADVIAHMQSLLETLVLQVG